MSRQCATHKERAKVPGAARGALGRIDDPNVDRCARRFIAAWEALAGFQPVNPIVRWLWYSLPRALTEDTFHRIQRGLDEVIQIPNFIRSPGRSEPEIDPHREPCVLRPDPGGVHRGPHGLVSADVREQ